MNVHHNDAAWYQNEASRAYALARWEFMHGGLSRVAYCQERAEHFAHSSRVCFELACNEG